ncbi:hypothetical protein MRX96_017228 [Rhipicephalus microplus]
MGLIKGCIEENLGMLCAPEFAAARQAEEAVTTRPVIHHCAAKARQGAGGAAKVDSAIDDASAPECGIRCFLAGRGQRKRSALNGAQGRANTRPPRKRIGKQDIVDIEKQFE